MVHIILLPVFANDYYVRLDNQRCSPSKFCDRQWLMTFGSTIQFASLGNLFIDVSKDRAGNKLIIFVASTFWCEFVKFVLKYQ